MAFMNSTNTYTGDFYFHCVFNQNQAITAVDATTCTS